ncbi:unnamed protein product [Phaedon cochleariae]|uniref:CRK SH3-binding GNRP n=1 Tax=Phaedon cochleariae TaxID=80249 RepID=A0A9N9SDI1_PHACE|nr:unnamed protein product [Phaedon cochleariae]
MQQLVDEGFYNNSPKSNGCERLSQRSKSPDDSISLQSESVGSLDSVLNCSREEDEMKELMDHDNMFIENHTSDILGANGTNLWEESCLAGDSFTSCNNYHRLSNADSGFASSVRSSGYSQTSTTSSQFVHHVKKQTNIESGFRSNVITNFSQSSSSSSSSVVMMSNSVAIGKEELPPAIPEKTKKKTERHPSPYDNVPEQKMGELLITCQRHQSHHSLSNSLTITNNWEQESNEPPPLPPKKKHIMAYMEMFGNCSHTSNQEFLRHSVHMVHAQYGPPVPQGLPTARSCAFGRPSRSYSTAAEDDRSPSPPRTPHPSNALPPALPPKQRSRKSSARSPPPTPTSFPSKPPPSPSSKPPPPHLLPDLLEHTTKSEGKSSHSPHFPSSPDSSPSGGGSPSPSFEVDLMEELDVERFLLKKKENEEGPDIRGGPIDGLIIQATKATKNGVFIYQEAFLTTYRTFISPKELIMKLIRRYNHFYYVSDKKPRSREAFALIVRVVSDLTTLDLDEELQLKLMNFVQQLISCGELTLAKALRVKHLQRHEAKQGSLRHPVTSTGVPPNCSGSRNATSLLEFKSEQIAEQMTLLDAELFMKIEIPEVLMWAQEQNEERSPNLTRFTEHFNKMSYWARTRILTAEGRDAREKYFSKFIKIMKHLRKINNFNSYLALLSALDSAPVRRLEWQKQVQEGLKDYCALIDSSSSFRAYRMALAETQPPCIPYIGLILQDLTFVHIGNTDLLSEGNINFSKRWQQFNILENMKKFKKETYTFKKQERIISFFDNFSDFIGEEDMWKLSETIKPRGCPVNTTSNLGRM